MMNKNLGKKINQYITEELKSESDSSKELIWNKLDINKTDKSSSSRLWKLISAILLLLLLFMSGMYFCKEENSTSQVLHTPIKNDNSTTPDQITAEYRKIKDDYAKLKDSLSILMKQIEIQSADDKQSIVYKDRFVYKKDTLYLKSDTIVKYKDNIIRDTIYLIEPPTEPAIASLEPEIIEEKSKRRNVVLFDLRNQVDNITPNSKEENKATITFSLNSN